MVHRPLPAALRGRVPTPRPGGRRLRAAFAAAALTAAACVCGQSTASAAVAAPGPTDLRQAEAIIKPSVVFIHTHWSGYLMNATYEGVDIGGFLSGHPGVAPRITADTACSGFVANPDGYIVTAGHCMDDTSMQYGAKGLLVEQAISKLERKLESTGDGLSKSTQDKLLAYGYKNWNVEGEDGGSPPDRTVQVFPAQASFGGATPKALPADVRMVRPFKKGDVALLKVSAPEPLPALTIAPPGSVTDGIPVVAAGYPGSVTATVDPTLEPSMKDGTVSGQQTVAGVPFTEISSAVTGGSSGAAVVNDDGLVLGTVSWQPGAETQAVNFMTDSSTITDLLASNGVSTAISATDQAYRGGLTAYFAGKYHDAAKAFNQVLSLEPNHLQAQTYLRLAVTNYAKDPLPVPPPKPSGPGVLPMALGLAGLVVIAAAAAAALMIRRRRGHGQPATVPPPTEVPAPTPAEAGFSVWPPPEPVAPQAVMAEPVDDEAMAERPTTTPEHMPIDGISAHDWAPAPPPLPVPEQRSLGEAPSPTPVAETSPGPLHLFVTYAREDRQLVERLRVGLQRLSLDVWIDDRLVGGVPWWEVILRQIRQSDAVLVAVSPALLQSQASFLERQYAARLGKVLLPVSVRPVRPELLPPDLAGVQMIDYSDPDVGAAFELADAIAHLPRSPELPDPLPEPPPVPLSYLSDLTARVRAASLTLDEQLALVSRLRSALGRPTEHVPALELLVTLQQREDLYIGPAREVDAILVAEKAFVAAPQNTQPPVEKAAVAAPQNIEPPAEKAAVAAPQNAESPAGTP